MMFKQLSRQFLDFHSTLPKDVETMMPIHYGAIGLDFERPRFTGA